MAPIEALYEKHGGNIHAIFESLNENPRKALKYPPKAGAEFARKYLEGGYSCLDADAKDTRNMLQAHCRCSAGCYAAAMTAAR
eukprot:9947-Heterococcus_DN1.PRE.4